MALTPDEKNRLKALRAEKKRLEKAIFDRRELGKLDRYDKVVGMVNKLESKFHVDKLIEERTKAKAVAELAEAQAKHGSIILKEMLAEAEHLTGMVEFATTDELLAAIDASYDHLQTFTSAEMRASMERVGNVAMRLDRELAIRFFGPDVIKKARSIGVVLGGGIDPKIVDSVWKGRSREIGRMFRTHKAELRRTVKDLVSIGRDSRKAFDDLISKGLPDADVSKWIKDLERKARAATSGVPGARKQFDISVQQARRYLADREAGKFGTRGPGKQYLADLRKAVRTGNSGAIKEAVRTWQTKKTAYNAINGMRTLTNETYRTTAHETAKERPWVYLMERRLSARHNKVDYCDAIALMDIGFGKGRAPIGQMPLEHFSGRCRDIQVVDRDFFKNDRQMLVFKQPKGWDKKQKRLSHDGDIAKAANKAKTPEDIDKLLKKYSLANQPKIKMKRVPMDEAPGTNTLS